MERETFCASLKRDFRYNYNTLQWTVGRRMDIGVNGFGRPPRRDARFSEFAQSQRYFVFRSQVAAGCVNLRQNT